MEKIKGKHKKSCRISSAQKSWLNVHESNSLLSMHASSFHNANCFPYPNPLWILWLGGAKSHKLQYTDFVHFLAIGLNMNGTDEVLRRDTVPVLQLQKIWHSNVSTVFVQFIDIAHWFSNPRRTESAFFRQANILSGLAFTNDPTGIQPYFPEISLQLSILE